MSTLNEMTDNVRTKLVIDPEKDIWGDSELQVYLNEGLTRFYAKADMKESWEDGAIDPLVDGQADYTKPANLRRLFWAAAVYTGATSTEADETPLTIITDVLGDFQKTHDMDYEGSQPEYIYEEDGKLWLYPVPNTDAVSDYTIKYKYGKRPAVLTSTDSPEIPTEWHFVIEDYAVWRAWKKLPMKEEETATAKEVWEESWRQAIQDILWTEGERLTWRPPILPSKRKK